MYVVTGGISGAAVAVVDGVSMSQRVSVGTDAVAMSREVVDGESRLFDCFGSRETRLGTD